MKTTEKIVILDDYAMNPGNMDYSPLRAAGDLSVYNRTSRQEAVERIKDADIVLTNKVPITKDILSRCPRIRYIGVLATGYNVVDVEECTRRGIVVTNVPAYSTPAVAQTVFALLLEYATHVGLHNDAVHNGEWCSCPGFFFTKSPLIELSGRTLGIFGFGDIGQQVARIALSFGMNVLVCSRTEKAMHDFNRMISASGRLSPVRIVSFDELLALSDFVSLHCPLTDDTRLLMNAQTIAKMKKGAVLINTARGALADETAVCSALDSGQLRAYCADVSSEEPMRQDSPLLAAENVILTPHIAWAHDSSRIRLFNGAVENVLAFLSGHPQNCVNAPA
ncbi:MAG: D-2-hydroxyacid dehydrogenase [Bacteroides sp.]|nr:D-2-hydroxyacid dehydrogenase [Prevotella sp.]MCM1408905.1 D-2-hydroxyacid dehydrogenase [Treponema brennaborense]MCM1470832.1 D-2-hydroxyacid dehydrogenase [Bacteroides sp.]